MKRTVTIVVAVIVGIALLGAGIVLGSKIGQEQALEAAAEEQGPWTDKDALVLPTFSDSTQKFEKLIEKARKGKDVSKQLTEQAVIVLHVEQSAEGQKFKEVVGDTADAMLLLSAGVTTDDAATVEQGIEAYRKAQEKLLALADEVNAAKGQDPESDTDSDDQTESPAEDQPSTE